MNITNEKTFETNIVNSLVQKGGYIQGNPKEYNAELGLDLSKLISFLQSTQQERLESLLERKTEEQIIQRITRELALKGSLDCLRHGIDDSGVHLDLAYFKPESGLNPDTLELYEKNILSVTRQVHYSTRETDKSLDLVLFLNGIPVATVELKNPFTGQDVSNAKNQFAYTRDNKEQIFVFKQRALVHFAVDPNEVHMTTKLEGPETKFLPFNKGNRTGAGNPDVKEGYKTSYLWEEVWSKDSWMDIINKFIHIEKKEIETPDGKKEKETIIFPRYHQLDVVRKLAKDTKSTGVGKNYLVQHSAGSGKSNSIAWLAYRLSSLHDETDTPMFNSIIVVTDRIVLDKQLQDTIYQFDHKQGVVQRIDKNSEQLGQALNKGVKIIITTIQKFGYILDKVSELEYNKYAIIVDEAHSSQGGESSKQMKEVLTSGVEEEEQPDTEDLIRESMRARGKQPNLSFYAFTATPKAKTLELFGVPGEDGLPKPFHLYSMRQAIEEGFILDVLQNYIRYESYFKIEKTIEDDPELSKKKANKAIAKYLTLHPYNLAQKTEVIVEHFKEFVAPQIGGQAKAMVVTSSRLHAVNYYKEFQKYIKEKKYKDIGILVAFSGTVDDDSGVHYREVELNGFKEKELPDRFTTDEYKILLVADKYQTGFDQPLLCAMYVDKTLSGVRAVQTLSRLNRTAPGKEKTFIMDFVNTFDEIYESFKPYYELTSIEEKSDPNVLYNLKYELTDMQVFWKSEIDQFAKVFFKKYQKSEDQAELYRLIQPAIDRFANLEEDEQELFKKKASQFLRAYAFLGQIITFSDIELEKFYAYLRLLRNALPKKLEERFQLNDKVALEYYKLSKKGILNVQWENEGVGSITSSLKDSGGDSYNKDDEKAPLSEIIKSINDRFGENLTEADKLLIEQVEMDMINDSKLQKQAVNNEIGNFKYGFDDVLMDKFIDRMEQNEDFFQKFLKNDEFKNLISEYLLKRVYKKLSKSASVKDLIKEGENQNLEFKSSLRWDVKNNVENKDLENVIIKTVTGFMNSEGGQLIIGVEDDGNVLGLEYDYNSLRNGDRDKFELHLNQSLMSKIGKEYIQFVRVSFEKINGKDVCLITVRPSSKPAYLKYGDKEEFYARTGNATNAFTLSEATEYIKTHWQ
jgi:type I restriction enzyme R subunit